MSLPEVPAGHDGADGGRTGEQAEILALVAPLRRFVLSRVRDVHDADDVVQETLTRVLAARGRLEDETLTAYAFAVARNLVATHHRQADVGRRHAARLVDRHEPEQPEHAVLAAEDRQALATALRQLPGPQRDQLVDHVLHDVEVGDLGGAGPGAVAAQLARTRARLRLDYLLALRGETLPAPRCRPVLLALSAGDRRRQAALRAGDHLSACATCQRLSEPLMQRRRALAGFLPWIPLGAWHGRLTRQVRSHPALTAAGATAVATAAVVAAVATAGGTAPAPTRPVAVRTTPAPSPTPDALPAAAELRGLDGRTVRARDVAVLAVPADEGFWVRGASGDRVWVQLRTRRESGERIRPGLLLTFTGVVVVHDGDFARRVGVTAAEGAEELTRQQAHVEVDAQDVTTR